MALVGKKPESSGSHPLVTQAKRGADSRGEGISSVPSSSDDANFGGVGKGEGFGRTRL